MTKIRITETVLRDGQQSQIATRMTTKEMIPILETLDNAGYHALEMWGGATFDSCLRFLNEDPWERLRAIRKAVKKTKLQMLLRGQNLLGYRNYADDVVRSFIQKSIENGIDIVRIFDALNDSRNLQTAVSATKNLEGMLKLPFLTRQVRYIPLTTLLNWRKLTKLSELTPFVSKTWLVS